MRIFKVVTLAAMCVSVNFAMAAGLYEAGTIKSVDVKNNTFTVELEKSGLTKTYNFPSRINFIDNGVTLVDKSAFKPGQTVNLELAAEKSRSVNQGSGTKKEYTLRGMTVK